MKRLILFAITLAVFPYAANAQKDVFFDAMKDELARSMKELKLENAPPPYFISYMINDSASLRIVAYSGAVVANSESRNRTLRTDVRVGDYGRDNYNFRSQSASDSDPSAPTGQVQIVTDYDYDTVRRHIWQETDRAYKAAVETLNRKNTALQSMTQTDRPPDFSKGSPTVSVAGENSLVISPAQWEERVNRIAGFLLRDKNIGNLRKPQK